MIIIGKILFILILVLFSLSNYMVTFKVIDYWIIKIYKKNICGYILLVIYQILFLISITSYLRGSLCNPGILRKNLEAPL